MLSQTNPYAKSEKSLRRIRQAIWDYDDTPREAQAGRVLRYLKARKLRGIRIERSIHPLPVGPYSGLTRQELAATGTCETDWF